jgi:hypothetical protein
MVVDDLAELACGLVRIFSRADGTDDGDSVDSCGEDVLYVMVRDSADGTKGEGGAEEGLSVGEEGFESLDSEELGVWMLFAGACEDGSYADVVA